MTEVDFYLEDLKSKFSKINPEEYCLSYSGGKDSHFLYWFIKEYLHEERIEIVGLNTYMEIPEIRDRIYKNSDKVLLPSMKPFEIKEKYGIPCYSKEQDDYIYRYQNAKLNGREPSISIKRNIESTNNDRKISQKAQKYVLSGNAHLISNKCCYYLKKKPFKEFEKKSGKKAILEVRGNESYMRRQKFNSCFTKSKKFTPLFDLTDELLSKIYKEKQIEIPSVYKYVNRTGCAGCPYGSYKNETIRELQLIPEYQKQFAIKYFKESYDVLKVPYDRKILLYLGGFNG